jgi:catechol 2,3-dioxygenase
MQKAPAVIAPASGVGAVHIAVTDAGQALRFYRDVVGLTVLDEAASEIRLGAPDRRELVVLHPGAAGPVPPRTTGLYHLAILLPGRRELARFIARLAVLRVPQSPTDHVATKADYLWDPDGNGIEVYADTPQDGVMAFDENGGFGAVDKLGRHRSGRDPIDLDELFAELRQEDQLDVPMPAGTKMGHVHLHVAHLRDAVDFYHGLIGFDVMGMMPRIGAAFLSAGGYHHHLGLNTWAGVGAPRPPDGVSGLRRFSIEVPSERDLETVLERLRGAGVPVAAAAGSYEVVDPSGNVASLSVRR